MFPCLNVRDEVVDPYRTVDKITVPCVSVCVFLGCVIDNSLEMFVNMKYMLYFHRELAVYFATNDLLCTFNDW
jgi:hypothetical protein